MQAKREMPYIISAPSYIDILILYHKFYKNEISPFFSTIGVHCKYEPTCSEYMMQAIEKYGAFKGSLLGIKRFLKCNPFSKGGYDPLK